MGQSSKLKLDHLHPSKTITSTSRIFLTSLVTSATTYELGVPIYLYLVTTLAVSRRLAPSRDHATSVRTDVYQRDCLPFTITSHRLDEDLGI
jgi:hypothetical protein